MTLGTVCSGIGAPELAFDAQPLWFAEIEKFPSAVLAHHYPDVPNLGDFTTDEAIGYMMDNPPDVFVGGTPCQAFSVAGKRNSLDDDRGNLTLVFTEVWHRLRAVGTKYAVWENVPGVLNTKDNAFGCFVSAMVGAEHPITVDGRWPSAGLVSGQEGVIAWRTLDAQYYGVPQRRRRIFAVVGHPGDFSVAKILFEPESVSGDFAKGSETGEETARSVGDCFTASSHGCNTRGVGTVRASGGDLGCGSESLVYENHPNDSRVKGPLNVCEQLTARNGTGGGNLPLVQEAGQYWNGADNANTLTSRNASGSQRMPDKDNFQAVLQPQTMNTIDANMNAKYGSDQWVAQKHYVFEPIPIHDQATRHSGKRGSKQDGKGNGLGVGKAGECSPTLTKGDKHAVAFNWQSGGDVRHNPSASVPDALTAHQTPAVQNSGMAVRRLTPVECERLQGFPDNWTQIPWRNKAPEDCPDGPRYKAIGNSMAIPCVDFIAECIRGQL